MKKMYLFGLAGALFLSVFTNGGNASADTMEEVTEDYTINWTEVWKNADSFSEEVDFGTADSQTRSIGSLATGSTAVSLSGNIVKSTGKTKGRILTTTTSATTSLRDVAYGMTSKGGKRMAVGTFTSTSTTSMGNTSGKSPFSGVTVHTATNNGKLYSSATGNTKAY